MEASGINIQDALKGILSNIEEANPDMVASARVSQAWKMCSSDTQRAHVDAVYTVPGTGASKVVIYVDSGIWATELNLQVEMIKLRMNLALQEILKEEGIFKPDDDQERIKSLRFAVSKDKYRGKRPCDVSTENQLDCEGMRVQTDPVSLSQAEEEQLQKDVACIEDPALRRAAYDAMKADMELKKGALISSTE